MRDKPSEHNPSVREVVLVQRCEMVQLCPLDNDLEDFITFKFDRAGKKAGEAINASGIQMIREKMTIKTGHQPYTKQDVYTSNLYPLTIGNLMVAAMNTVAEMGVLVINGDIIKIVTSQTR
ncbi:hypothetical protein I5F07_01885 [Proteus vulgaris]|uniref:hypothetical protein n=1 Tax=Proteus TaxID=583 RepID=UPI000B41DD08|nr:MULTISPECIES: hypothetical protein [Proteus]NBN60602.1 hypothetical protein [Proteus sp. G2639]RNT28880.1 hypothetical protein B9475_006430 [Proteus mirabilis]AYY80884.1 hypothetical protein EGX81_08310 [Proteus vulgaris]MBG5983622.1 hypothetical protein [Proteus vulgaris]MBI6509868.1 hypothetical protein [Proteus sp. PR00174]